MQTFKLLLDPLAFLSLLVLIGILRKMFRRQSAWGGIGILLLILLMASPVVVNPMMNRFESMVPQSECRFDSSLPIVVLGGGVNGQANTAWDIHHLHPASMIRVMEGSRLAAVDIAATGRTPLMIFSGGVNESVVESEVMANFAVVMGTSPERILRDAESKNTFENAKRVRRLLDKSRAGDRIRLVTSAVHMLRASQTFTKAGMQVCPVNTHYQGLKTFSPYAVIPQTSVLVKFKSLLHELIGLAYYSLTGKL